MVSDALSMIWSLAVSTKSNVSIQCRSFCASYVYLIFYILLVVFNTSFWVFMEVFINICHWLGLWVFFISFCSCNLIRNVYDVSTKCRYFRVFLMVVVWADGKPVMAVLLLVRTKLKSEAHPTWFSISSYHSCQTK